jgi:hypothetical protein
LNLLSIARVGVINGKDIVSHNVDPTSIIISFFATLGGPSANLEQAELWGSLSMMWVNGTPHRRRGKRLARGEVIATDPGVAARTLPGRNVCVVLPGMGGERLDTRTPPAR